MSLHEYDLNKIVARTVDALAPRDIASRVEVKVTEKTPSDVADVSVAACATIWEDGEWKDMACMLYGVLHVSGDEVRHFSKHSVEAGIVAYNRALASAQRADEIARAIGARGQVIYPSQVWGKTASPVTAHAPEGMRVYTFANALRAVGGDESKFVAYMADAAPYAPKIVWSKWLFKYGHRTLKAIAWRCWGAVYMQVSGETLVYPINSMDMIKFFAAEAAKATDGLEGMEKLMRQATKAVQAADELHRRGATAAADWLMEGLWTRA